MRVYFHHIRRAGLCAPGFRAWAINKGWTNQQIRDFLRDGLPAEVVEGLDDPFAKRVLEVARAEAAKSESNR